MKKAKRLLRSLSPKHIAKHLRGNQIYRETARRYDLVYFGSVSSQDDEHELVRGLTVSADHQDQHYCVGTVEGYDVILLERTDLLTFPGKPATPYRWVILQVDLRNVDVPHMFIDTKQHSSAFYDTLMTKYPRLAPADANMFADHDPTFMQAFNVYTAPDDRLTMSQLLTHDMTATLGHHFAHLDFELFDDRLIVYAAQRTASKQLLDYMFRAGIWLAREIETNNPV